MTGTFFLALAALTVAAPTAPYAVALTLLVFVYVIGGLSGSHLNPAITLGLVVSLYIFMRGHNLPGGGFIAGLITAVALVLQYMALGQSRAEALLRAEGGRRFVRWIGMGLGIAGLTGVAAFAFGQPFLTSAHGHPYVALLGELPLASAALFDLGVYITVVGATLLTLSTLGAITREPAAIASAQPGKKANA